MYESNWAKNLLFATLCFGAAGVIAYYLMAADRISDPVTFRPTSRSQQDIELVAQRVDGAFMEAWNDAGLTPVGPADNLTVARRLALALAGTIPSLEEIREIEKQVDERQITWWLSRLLEDRRTSNHLAERFARALVGVEDGPFLIFRRRRFVNWLSDQIRSNRPYDDLVSQILTEEGLWTDTPAVNFYTRTVTEDNESRPDPILLAGRTSRAFLGMRIDCLQCHDDFLGTINLGAPDDLTGGTQFDFHALAAFFNQTENSLLGIRDNPELGDYVYKLLDAEGETPIPPSVPFHLELDDDSEANPRIRLAKWVTHPDNRPFARAIVNRVWAILFARPLIEPVDDIPLEGPFPTALEILVDDLVDNHYDLHRLIRVVAATRVFRLASSSSTEVSQSAEDAWAVFPLVRLRPDQVAGGIVQSTSLTTIDSTAHIVSRLAEFGLENDFVERFGDPGEDEFKDRGETITQRLLMLNGKMIDERLKAGLTIPGHLVGISPNIEKAIEIVYLTTLTRRPNANEIQHFVSNLESADEKNARIIDVYWALINSAEFRWNH
jgi:hypothetical protein